MFGKSCALLRSLGGFSNITRCPSHSSFPRTSNLGPSDCKWHLRPRCVNFCGATKLHLMQICADFLMWLWLILLAASFWWFTTALGEGLPNNYKGIYWNGKLKVACWKSSWFFCIFKSFSSSFLMFSFCYDTKCWRYYFTDWKRKW